MWEFYLVTCEQCFRHQGQMVFQIQLAKQPGTVPLTRDYITRFEEQHPLGEGFSRRVFGHTRHKKHKRRK